MLRFPASRFTLLGTALFALSSMLLAACGDDDDDKGLVVPPVETIHATFPLRVGHVWNFDSQITEGLAAAEAYSLEITGTRVIDGETYFALVDVDDDSPSDIYLRQSGHQMWAVPLEFLDGATEADDTITPWVQEHAADSFPWKYADTDAAVNVPWSIFEASGEVVILGFNATISVQVTGTHLGSAETTVPAGTFTTARTRIDQHVSIVVGNFEPTTIDNTLLLEVADGVGLVRIHETSANSSLPAEDEVEESKLTSYDLAK